MPARLLKPRLSCCILPEKYLYPSSEELVHLLGKIKRMDKPGGRRAVIWDRARIAELRTRENSSGVSSGLDRGRKGGAEFQVDDSNIS